MDSAGKAKGILMEHIPFISILVCSFKSSSTFRDHQDFSIETEGLEETIH